MNNTLKTNIYGPSRQSSIKIRLRYELLFELIQKSGLRISEALGVKVADVRKPKGADSIGCNFGSIL